MRNSASSHSLRDARTPTPPARTSGTRTFLPSLQTSATYVTSTNSVTSTHATSERSRLFRTPISASDISRTSSSRGSHSHTSRDSEDTRENPESVRGSLGDSLAHGTVRHTRPGEGTDRHDRGRKAQRRPLTNDPQTAILNYIMNSRAGRATLPEIGGFLEWETKYQPTYGDLLEFVHSYQSLFHMSPVDDTVTVQTEAILSYDRSRLLLARRQNAPNLTSRREASRIAQEDSLHVSCSDDRRSSSCETDKSGTETDGIQAGYGNSTADDYNTSFSNKIGSISYGNVAERFDLIALASYYRRHGYEVALQYDVLRVSHRVDTDAFLPAAEVMTDASFDMYLFPTGGVVWWGLHRSAHRVVDRHFLSSDRPLKGGVEGRYPQEVIDELFPSWCTFEVELNVSDVMGIPVEGTKTVGEQGEENEFVAQVLTTRDPTDNAPLVPVAEAPPRDEDVDAALVRFSRRLRYEHYILPGNPVYRAQVMLAVSHCLARCARMDYYEHVTQATHRSVLAIPGDFKNLLDYFSTKKTIDRLSGELLVAQLAIRTLKDSPDFLWEMPWLQPFYDLTDAQYASGHRLSWFAGRSDALLAQLASVKGRRFRLFMLGSDVFLIVLLILDVFFMTSRLVVKLYFRLPEDE